MGLADSHKKREYKMEADYMLNSLVEDILLDLEMSEIRVKRTPRRKSFPCKWEGKPGFGEHTAMASRLRVFKAFRRECVDAWQY